MKTLAVVTMFFLPGSFVSALFSMPMFEWDKVDLSSRFIGVSTMPQFGLYWVITIPLTLVTFILYFWWLWFSKKEAITKSELFDSHEKDDFHKTELELEEKYQESDAFTARLGRKRKDGTKGMNGPACKGPSRS